jgi:hypothetical protein
LYVGVWQEINLAFILERCMTCNRLNYLTQLIKKFWWK